VHNSKIKRISLAVLLALMPVAANAAGLGKMTVMSGLGEPLNAEIEIAASKDELSSLTARIAPPETYAEQNIERTASLNTVRVELSRKADGTPVLKLSSSQPVNDPFLDMLIQVDWPTGRLLREYTALMDPPGYGDRAAGASPEVTAETKQLPATASPSKKNGTKNVTLATAPRAEPSAPAPDTYVTKRGDTLRNVARRMQVEDVTLEQMLVGLYQSNRSAFTGDNMNQLKVGQIIRKPRDEELRAIDPQEAVQEVRLHTTNWHAYRNDVAQAVSQSQAAPSDSQAQSSGGRITTRTEDQAAPLPEGPRDVVKLSRSEVAGDQKVAAAGTGSGVADDKLRALEEESTAQDKAIAEVNERIAFFEKQIQDMQKLLLVQNQILAELQKGKPVDGAQLPEPAPAPDTAQPEQQSAEAPQAAQPPAPKPTPAPAEPAPSLLDDLLQNPMLLPAGGGILAILLGGWLLLRRQRRKNLDSFEKGILTSSGLKTDTVFGTTGGAAVDTGDTTFMTDFSHRHGDGMIDTSDVDPISEAEVYMAYGRDAQAEEILKDAIAKEPKRYELHLKLLEIYANRKDAAAFETLAGELYGTLGNNDPTWLKVAEMGRALEPDNPMYAPAGEQPATSSTDVAQGVAGVASAAATATVAVQAEEPAEEQPQDNSLDFDLGMLAAEEDQASVGIEKESETVEFESLPDLGGDVSTEAEAEQAPETESSTSDLQFELPESNASTAQFDAAEFELPSEEPAAVEQPEAVSFDLPGLELDSTSTPESAPEAAPQEETETDALANSFDLPELPTMESPGEAEPASEVTPDEPVGEISFELPELAPAQDETVEAEPEQTAVEAEALLPSFDIDLPKEPDNADEQPAEAIDLTAPAEEIAAFDLSEIPDAEPETPAADVSSAEETPVEEIVFDVPASEETEQTEEAPLDFNFSLDVEADESAQESAEPATPIPDLDLSGISLDIAEPSSDAFDNAEEITLAAGEESADVDTKLDLVTAYMDMGDNEGARELLEEVLQEGGPKQRERAQKMLESLG
jgi:pilus assembly protein FimV